MPHLVEMQNAYAKKNFTVIGVTAAAREQVAAFGGEQNVNYPMLAAAQADQDAYGVSLVWGTMFFLINPKGEIVSQDLKQIEKQLANKLG